MKVVYALDSLLSLTWWNPEFASILLKYLLPSNEDRVSSNLGKG